MAARRAPEQPDLDALLAAKEMVLVCGSGGVGKTTTAAAMAVHAATRIGGRVIIALAVQLGPARLIDNIRLTVPQTVGGNRT